MAEMLTYSQALTSLTGGRGDYHMHFLRYEEVPTHIAQKVIDSEARGREGGGFASAADARRCASRRRRSHDCAICERTLLVGERATRFSPDGGEPLRRRLPALQRDRARARLGQGGLADDAGPSAAAAGGAALAWRRSSSPARGAEEPVVSEPILRRLSKPEQAIVEAAELFNASPYRRTVGGIAQEPRRAARSRSCRSRASTPRS